MSEAIAAVMVVGLSVDFSIHMGKTWMLGLQDGIKDKKHRFISTANQMGPTVLAAGVTTAASCSIMFACQMAFFYKMATLIVLTMVGSLLFTLFLFMPLLLVAYKKDDPHFGDFECRKRKKTADELTLVKRVSGIDDL